MQWPRIPFVFTLILVVVPAVSVMPSNALSQSDVTTATQVRTTGANNNTVAREPFSLYYPCKTSLEVKFNATEGQRFHIQWTQIIQTPSELDFYIATPSFYIAPGTCTLSGEPLYSIAGATGSVDWVAPSTGQYVAWLVNSYTIGYLSGILSIETPAITTVSSVSSVTARTTELLALTTAASAPVSQVGLPFGNLGLLGAVVAVAVVVSVLVVTRRRKPSIAATVIQERPAAAQEAPREAIVPPPVAPTKPVPPQPVISEIPPIISTGYADLDKALNGGIPEEFAVVIVSPSFDERDLLLRKVVNSALSSGRLAILISNDMGRTKDMASRYPNGFYVLFPQADRVSQHGPNLLKIPSFENLSDATISLGLVLKDVLAKEKATKRIMIIDILSDLLLRYKSIVTRRWLTDFVGKRKAEGFTIIATLNPLTATKEETQNIIDFFDGVIEIFEKPLMERSRRFLMIRKMYGQKYSDSEVLMDRDKLF